MKQVGLWAVILLAELVAMQSYGTILLHLLGHVPLQAPSDLDCFQKNAALALGRAALSQEAVANVCAFMYPPPFILVVAPLVWLSSAGAYVVWSAVNILCLAGAARAIGVSWRAVALGLAAPAALLCIIIGQNGGITSALLMLSLGLAASNPVLAGIAAGCLIIKPQLAMLLPICYFSSRNWRAFGSAALTALALCAVSALVLGPASWQHFLHSNTALMRMRLEMPWEQPMQNIMASVFMTLRSLHGGLRLAYGAQSVASLAAVGAAAYLWWPGVMAPDARRLAATLCLVLLATPFAYIYDYPALGFALAACAAQRHWEEILPLAVFWLVTGLYIMISMTSFLTGSCLLILLLAQFWPQRNGPRLA
jgi:hypothetical protein